MSVSITSRDQAPGTVQRRTALLIGAIVAAGLVSVLAIWAGVFILTSSEQRTAIAQARTNASNLSAAFQEEVGRELDRISAAMDLVAQRMRAAPGGFDIHEWASQLPLLPAAIQATIIGPDGRILSSTVDPPPGPIDLSDREHFRVHLDGKYHGMFISKPVIGRATDKLSIELSRRVDAADGASLA
jgi:hypothetical protein